MNIIRKGFSYLKNRGVREFAARAAEKYADAHFDYDRWIAAHKISSARAGYQKSLQMKEMPAVYVMILSCNEKSGSHSEGGQDGSLARASESVKSRLARTVLSLHRQTYRKKEISEILTKRMKQDDLVVFLHEGDILPEQALFEVVLASRGGALCIYSDEDSYSVSGGTSGETLHYKDPLFKPDFDPDYLRSENYIGQLFAVRVSILRKAMEQSEPAPDPDVPAARALAAPAAYYEMILLCTDLAGGKVVHIPKVLCHAWEKHQTGTSRTGGKAEDRPGRSSERDVSEEDCAMREVLKRDLKRRGESGIVEYGPLPGTFHIRYLRSGNPLVSIVIPGKDHIDLLKKCLDSIHLLTTWENLEIVVVENNSVCKETFDFYHTVEKEGYKSLKVRVVSYGKTGFNFSEIINEGVKAAAGDYVVLMNNDVTVRTPDWIERLISQCSRENVGAAGPKLLYPDGTVQSAGIVAGIMGFAGSMMVGEKGDDPGYMARASVTSGMSAVTAACMMVRKSAFRRVGGFSGKLAVSLNDVDFCLKLGEAGYRVIFDPTAVLCHHESRSRGYEDTKEKRDRFELEKKIFRERWRRILKEGDPHYNPNLSLRKCDYSQKK